MDSEYTLVLLELIDALDHKLVIPGPDKGYLMGFAAKPRNEAIELVAAYIASRIKVAEKEVRP